MDNMHFKLVVKANMENALSLFHYNYNVFIFLYDTLSHTFLEGLFELCFVNKPESLNGAKI